MASSAHQKISEHFRSFDKNGDGTINKKEFKSVFSDMSHADCDKMFNAVDKDSSGSISYEEFMDWVMAPGKGTQNTKMIDEALAIKKLEFQFEKERFAPVYPLDGDKAERLFDVVESWGREENQDNNIIVFDGTIQSIQNKREPIVMAIKRDTRMYQAINKDGGIDGDLEEQPEKVNKCEEGHKLKRSPKEENTCNVCGEEGTLWRCNKCDYDVCKNCYLDPNAKNEEAKPPVVDMLGVYVDTIHREGEDQFKTLVVGSRDSGKGIFLAAYPLDENNRFSPEVWPVKLMHFVPDQTSDRPGSWLGCWIAPSKEFDNADDIIKHYKEDTAILGDLDIEGDITYHIAGLVYLYECQWPDGPQMSSKDAFESLLYTCKINAMYALQEAGDKESEVFLQISQMQKDMEDIYNACTTKLQIFMLRRPEEFFDMADPLEEIIGHGMGYTGLMFAERFKIVIATCKNLEAALAVCRDKLQAISEEVMEDERGFEVNDWNSKSQASIYTKITDYADKQVEPQILKSCGLMGIKDYVRTRLICKKDGQKCVDKYLNMLRKAGLQIPQKDIVSKDKSKRFQPDGVALYVTGFLLLTVSDIADEGDFKIRFYICKCPKEGRAEDNGLWAVPFEIQVVNQAALSFINKAHHAYEIERVCQRISAVCSCSKDPATKDLLPQLACTHCMYRRSMGLGYCPFCHLCFKSACQQKNCTLPCCVERNQSVSSVEDQIEAMDVAALKSRVLALEAELRSYRVNT